MFIVKIEPSSNAKPPELGGFLLIVGMDFLPKLNTFLVWFFCSRHSAKDSDL